MIDDRVYDKQRLWRNLTTRARFFLFLNFLTTYLHTFMLRSWFTYQNVGHLLSNGIFYFPIDACIYELQVEMYLIVLIRPCISPTIVGRYAKSTLLLHRNMFFFVDCLPKKKNAFVQGFLSPRLTTPPPPSNGLLGYASL